MVETDIDIQDEPAGLKMKLICRQLSFVYPGSTVPVIDRLSFVMEGEGFQALFGPSGVGKTSLARIIAGMITDHKGEVVKENLPTVLYSYNLERLPGWLPIGDHLDRVCPEKKISLKNRLVSEFEMQELMGSRYSSLSMGQQNRINLIRYLLQEFDLLVMDESLANVDEKLRAKIIQVLKALFPDKMFLYISHNLMEVSKYCRKILVLGSKQAQEHCQMINGLDLYGDTNFDRQELDQVILRIMDAF